MSKPHSMVLTFEDNKYLSALYGEHDVHLQTIENLLDISTGSRGNELTLSGGQDQVRIAHRAVEMLWDRLEKGLDVGLGEVEAAIRFCQSEQGHDKRAAINMNDTRYAIQTKRVTISPRTPNQANYIESIKSHDLVFGLGPAGTGKTYLAVAQAVSMYLAGEVSRLVLCRPAVEAGEHLGFLPGDMQEKIDPYLRPIYDALYDMMSKELVEKKIAAGDIEIAPLAFMRGRTLKNAFIILDEAQNTSTMQMKMILTRLGEASHMVITGDPSQIDLPKGMESGLHQARDVLADIPEIKFCSFDAHDVVRHKLVGKIVTAYDNHKKKNT